MKPYFDGGVIDHDRGIQLPNEHIISRAHRDGILTVTDAGPHIPNYGGNAKQRRVRRRRMARLGPPQSFTIYYYDGDVEIVDDKVTERRTVRQGTTT